MAMNWAEEIEEEDEGREKVKSPPFSQAGGPEDVRVAPFPMRERKV